jgi:hypothetical protein
LSAQLLKDSLDDDGEEGDRARREVGEEIVRTKTREFRTLGVVLGSRYTQSPIIVDDGSAPPAEDHATYEPSASPGCLAPHAWLPDGTSLYDHFGLGYTLLAFDDAIPTDAFTQAAKRAGAPLTVISFRDPQLRALYDAPLALIRPDQYVAWRGAHADAARILAILSGHTHQNAANEKNEIRERTA